VDPLVSYLKQFGGRVLLVIDSENDSENVIKLALKQSDINNRVTPSHIENYDFNF
jgi:hypothetical protein